MHVEWETSDWSGARVDPAITCLSWAPLPPSPSTVTDAAGRDTNNNNGDQLGVSDSWGEGWLGTGASNGTVGITRTRLHPPADDALHTNAMDGRDRINYNLRGHTSPITFVVWNRQPLKLASCDENGMIYVWVPYEDRWSVELVNERSVKVRHFCWSPSGHAALISYEDNFVLIGSATGNRIWSHTYEPVTKKITCGAWSADSRQVLLATDAGTAHVLSDQGINVTEVTLRADVRIDSLVWSTSTLAVTFDDGIVYLLRAYDDVDPVIIHTGMTMVSTTQWSINGEYLAIVGKRGDVNHLLVHDRAGRRRLSADVPTSNGTARCAFTWAHDDQAVMFACAGELRVGRLSTNVPSLRHLCSYRVFRRLGIAADDKCDKLPLASRERRMVNAHNYHIVQCRVPSERTLQRAVTYPTDWRWYCTIRPAGVGGAGGSHTSYILYMEHAGSLVPILSARLTSRILPEFQIQLCTAHSAHLMSIIGHASAIDLATTGHDAPDAAVAANQFIEVEDLPPGRFMRATAHTQSAIHLGGYVSRTSAMWRRSKRQLRAFVARQFRSPSESPAHNRQLLAQRRRQSLKNTAGDLMAANNTNNLLVQVTSNVWCTRFKVSGVDCGDLLPPYMGHVTYKTSVLHLQPRQMTVHVVDLKHRNAKFVAIEPTPDSDDVNDDESNAPAIAPTDGEIFVRPRRQQMPNTSVGGGEQINIAQVVSEFAELRTTCLSHMQTLRAYKTSLEAAQVVVDKQRSLATLFPHNQHTTNSAQLLKKLTVQLKQQQHLLAAPPPPLPTVPMTEPTQRRRSSPTIAADTAWPALMDDIEYIDDDDALIVTKMKSSTSRSSQYCNTSDFGRGQERHASVPYIRHPLVMPTSTQQQQSTSNDDTDGQCSSAVCDTTVNDEHARRVRNVTAVLERLQNKVLPLLDPATAGCRRPVPLYTAPQLDVARMRQRINDLQRRLALDDTPPPVGGGWTVADGTVNSVMDDLRGRVDRLRLAVEQRAFNRPRPTSAKRTVRQSLRRARLFGAAKDSVGATEFPTDVQTGNARIGDHVIVLQNKTPFWNEQSQVYQLDFGGRVTQESAKNFQIEHDDVQVMQFGRIEQGAYTLDFQAPFSAVQAFAVALASITQRLK